MKKKEDKICRVRCVSFHVKADVLTASTPSSHLFCSFLHLFVFPFLILLSISPPPSLLPSHAHAHHICYRGKNMLASSFYLGVQSPISVVK